MLTRQSLLPALACLCLATPVLAEGSFTLENRTGYTVTAVYAGPSDDTNWGDNILQERIAHNETLEVTLDTEEYGCMWDIRYEFANGDEFEEYDIDICRIDGSSYTIE